MTRRSLWLLLALALGFGVPFYAFGLSGFELVPAILLSVVGLAGAVWAVRQSRG